jgi:hypothetical protein
MKLGSITPTPSLRGHPDPVQAAKSWWYANYESPISAGCPREDGHWISDWGLFDARTEIEIAFGYGLPGRLLDAVVRELEADGTTEWVPTGRRR